MYVCADTEGDCTYGTFDPYNDGIDPDETQICTREPGEFQMLLAGLAALIVISRRRPDAARNS